MTQPDFVKSLNIVIITSLLPFIDKRPVLKELLNKSKNPSNDWDFYMTIAGAGSYLQIYKVSDAKNKELLIELAEFDKQSIEALNNFNDFIKNNKSKNIDFKTSVGF